ncbi:MAG: 4-alpha-glucanotransferase, partial [Elusimicrobia bacterium]|nr:4-alpha-glucanotransferase [Elusimicrobiota bacterium]
KGRVGVAEPAAPSGPSRPGLAAAPWWKGGTRAAVTMPLYALRRAQDDPGIGKFTDLGAYFRDELAPEGVTVMHLLPHFAVKGESPYAPVSLQALNEDYVDWAAVPEVASDAALKARLAAPAAELQAVHYDSLRAREQGVGREAWARFERGELDRGTARGRAFASFQAENASWLGDYADFMALSTLIGKPTLAWTPAEEAAARADARFAGLADEHRFAQWVAAGQMKDALGAVHAAGGRVLFDIPMFRAKDSVDAWKHPDWFKDLRTRNPGIINQWVHEDWKDLALWDWTRMKAQGFAPQLDPFRHWLKMGFDGGRVDALHFAYGFGDGQLASGDEAGDDYVSALGRVFQESGALPLAEAFNGKADNARRYGFITVYGNWKKLSAHDDPRGTGFMGRFLDLSRQPVSGASARFVGFTLGDEWGDPVPVKTVADGMSYWRYRVPLAGDADYAARAPADIRAQLGAYMADLGGNVWSAGKALWDAFAKAAGSFVKKTGDTVEIWAASLDWFLEEWGRDTFVSLPGLLLATGRVSDAMANIRRFGSFEKDGLIPNRIPQGGPAEYNTVDGSMWFVQALKKAGEYGAGDAFLRAELPVVRKVMAAYAAGTGYDRYGRFNRIAMDADGLIMSPA